MDGEKMSKSYGNTVEIFGEEKPLRKKIMGIKMDSRTPAEPKPDADENLAIQLLKLVAPPAVRQDFEETAARRRPGLRRFEEGACSSTIGTTSPTARTKRAELAANLDYVNGVLTPAPPGARAGANRFASRPQGQRAGVKRGNLSPPIGEGRGEISPNEFAHCAPERGAGTARPRALRFDGFAIWGRAVPTPVHGKGQPNFHPFNLSMNPANRFSARLGISKQLSKKIYPAHSWERKW